MTAVDVTDAAMLILVSPLPGISDDAVLAIFCQQNAHSATVLSSGLWSSVQMQMVLSFTFDAAGARRSARGSRVSTSDSNRSIGDVHFDHKDPLENEHRRRFDSETYVTSTVDAFD